MHDTRGWPAPSGTILAWRAETNGAQRHESRLRFPEHRRELLGSPGTFAMRLRLYGEPGRHRRGRNADGISSRRECGL